MIIVLAYHSISTAKYEHAVTPEMFEWQLRFLQKRCTMISVSELVSLLEHGNVNSGKYAVITFDDGVRDLYENALPILKKLNIPATIFMITGFAEKTHTNASGITFTYLDWDEMKAMGEGGLVDIQSHTHTHPLLTTLSEREQEEEFLKSKHEIEIHLGSVADRLAYPKGNYDDRVKGIAEKYFSYAFGPVGIIERADHVDHMALPRIIVSANLPLWKFRLMIHSWYWRLRALRNRIQKIDLAQKSYAKDI